MTSSHTADARQSEAALPTGEAAGHRWLQNLPRFAMLILLIVVIVLFSILIPGSFATVANFKTVLYHSAVLTLLALAVMVPLIAGDFDLSIASVLGFTSILAAGLPARAHMAVGPAILAVLAVGAVIGLIHAVLIVRWHLSAVVVTLGSSTILTGLTLWYTGGKVIYQGIPESLSRLGADGPFSIPLPIVYMVVVAAVLWFVLEKRPWGRYLYATGSSQQSARLAGIKTNSVRVVALVTCSTLSALAGIVLTAQLSAGNPTVSNAYFLPAFAGAFLSLAAFRLGFFNPLGVVLAVYLLAFGVSGLTLMGAPFWVEPVFNGAALIVAIGLAQWSSRRSRKAVAES